MDRKAKTFCLLALAVAAFIFLTVGLINYIVDPWGLNYSVSVKGFNERKIDPLQMARLSKAYGLYRVKPQAVAIGSSTTEHGIDLAHPAWSRFGSSYNMAFAGASVDEMFVYVREAHRLSPLKSAAIGLDFFSFNAHREQAAQTAQAVDVFGSVAARVQPYFSRAMLMASFKTVYRQSTLFGFLLANGQSSEEGFKQWRTILGGQRNLFIQGTRLSIQSLLPQPAARFELRRGKEPATFERFRELLQFCVAEGIDLRVFIAPAHAWQLESVRALGLWPSFELWKLELAKSVDMVARSNNVQIPLWDFADYNAMTTEPVPPRNTDAADMRWFWDAVHYKLPMGKLIQDRMTGNGAQPEIPAYFGVKLTPLNVATQLASVRANREQYAQSNPEDVAGIGHLVARERLRMQSR